MKKYLLLIVMVAMPISSNATGWSTKSKIASIGQYGANIITIKFENEVSQCIDTYRLNYDSKLASEPDAFFSTLMTAYVTGKNIQIYLDDPVNCGGLDGQLIARPNYIKMTD